MADVVNSDDEDVPRVPLQRGPITRHAPAAVNKPLFIRYPGSRHGWTLFDENNVTAQHQKKGLELFIESGKETLDVSIPHSMGGQFVATFNKTFSKEDDNNDNDTIVYSYTPVATGAVQMMYAEPAYVAYINRVTT